MWEAQEDGPSHLCGTGTRACMWEALEDGPSNHHEIQMPSFCDDDSIHHPFTLNPVNNPFTLNPDMLCSAYKCPTQAQDCG